MFTLFIVGPSLFLVRTYKDSKLADILELPTIIKLKHEGFSINR